MPANQMDLQAYARFLTACAAGSALQRRHADRRDPQGESRLRLLLAAVLSPLRHPRDEERHPRTRARERLVRRPSAVRARPRRHVQSVQGAAQVCRWRTTRRWGRWICRHCGIRSRGRGCGCTGTATTNSVEERNKSAAIGAGATPDSLDLPSMTRIEQWIWDLQPPVYPATRIDQHEGRGRTARLGRRLRLVSRVRAAEHRSGDGARRHRHRHRARALVHRGARGGDEQDWRGSPVEVQSLPQDRRLRQHAARRPVAARAVSAQRIGARSARAALPRGTPGDVLSRLRRLRLGRASASCRAASRPSATASASTRRSAATATADTSTARSDRARRRKRCWNTSRRCEQ